MSIHNFGFVVAVVALLKMDVGTALSLTYNISKTWDGDAVSHDPVFLTLSPAEGGVKFDMRAPFFDDSSDGPPGKAGEAVWKLWDYEVVEAFFLGNDERYLEVEFSPFGCHLLLILEGVGNAINFCLPVDFTATIDEDKKHWSGSAFLSASYFPVNVNKFNAYAIHGKDDTRTYESLYPVPKGKYQAPNFHRLEYFQPIAFSQVLPSNPTSSLSELWSVHKDPAQGCPK